MDSFAGTMIKYFKLTFKTEKLAFVEMPGFEKRRTFF